MKTLNRALVAALCAGALLTGCAKDEGGTPSDEGNNSYFDFATTKTGDISINFDLSGYRFAGDRGILVEVYASNPWDESVNRLFREGETGYTKPIFKAVTDKTGKFDGKILLPTYLKKVFVAPDPSTAIGPVEVAVANGAVDMNAATAVRSAATRASYSIPSGFYAYPGGDWDATGLPNYLTSPGETVPAGLLTDIRKVLKSSKTLTDHRPDLVYDGDDESQYKNHSIRVVEECEIEFVFLTSSATWANAMAYYTYPTDNKPANPDNLERRTIIFPKISGTTHPLKSGDKVKLKYWNGTEYVDRFPAGVTVGFCLMPNYFRDGEIKEVSSYGYQATIVYSDPSYNLYGKTADQGRRQQSVALFDYTRELVVIGFEDRTRGTSSKYNDNDFDDALFYCNVNPFDAIDPGDDLDPDPEPEPEPQPYLIEYAGTLAFEDLWPWRGDYDMNDVGITYNSTVYYNADNTIYKSVDTFTPVCKGGQHTNGFGFQYGVAPSMITKCSVAATPGAPVYAYDKVAGKDLEAGQGKAVVMLFGDVKEQVSGTASDKDKSTQVSLYSYTTTTEYNNVTATQLGFPPYNPFITVQPAGTGEDPRAREIHLTNMAPTDKGDDPANIWFGKGHDKSDRANYWYVSDWLCPFAINVPTDRFRFPQENQRIDACYPKFASWAASSGANDADWWK